MQAWKLTQPFTGQSTFFRVDRIKCVRRVVAKLLKLLQNVIWYKVKLSSIWEFNLKNMRWFLHYVFQSSQIIGNILNYYYWAELKKKKAEHYSSCCAATVKVINFNQPHEVEEKSLLYCQQGILVLFIVVIKTIKWSYCMICHLQSQEFFFILFSLLKHGKRMLKFTLLFHFDLPLTLSSSFCPFSD